jgi:hypothetical protein
MVLAIAFTTPAVHAQDGGEEPLPDTPIEGDPAIYETPLDTGSEGVAPAAVDLVLAQPPSTLNYQGYLTDSAGAPFDGAVDIAASLFAVEAAGVSVWGPETHADVVVDNGHFHLVLGDSLALLPGLFDRALWLSVTVDGTEMPRQPLRPSAYALGLVPGAQVEGNPGAGSPALTVRNTSVAAGSVGLHTVGNDFGLYAEETGAGDVAIRTPDYVDAGGYRSGGDSYFFASALNGVPDDVQATSTLLVDAMNTGGVEIRRSGGAVDRYFFIPIDIPAVLMGQPVTVEQVTLYYDLSHAASFIDQVSLIATTQVGSASTLMNSNTNLVSIAPTSESYTPGDAVLSLSSGPLALRVRMHFDDPAHVVSIGGVRVRLGHR